MTSAAPTLRFPPFRLDLRQVRLWRGDTELPVRRKTLEVLRHLVEHADEVVSAEQLLDALWPGVHVTEVVPRVCIRELRELLGDDGERARFIQTVHRRGYRFVAKVRADRPRGESRTAGGPRSTLAGRTRELGQLTTAHEAALQGRRRVVFVRGEPGIGKTALVDAFLAGHGERAARGQCVEPYGAGEPYLPLLEALGRLGQGRERGRLVTTLERHAPAWLLQLPALVDPRKVAALRLRAAEVTPGRMLRELAEGLEALARTGAPLVLVLEDLHWCDPSTVAALALVARRGEPARLMIVGTFRPGDLRGAASPLAMLVAELRAHGQAEEVALEGLGEEEVSELLVMRLTKSVLPPRTARVLHRSTGGNPLLLAATLDDWIERRKLVLEDGVWTLAGDLDRLAGEIAGGIRDVFALRRRRLPAADREMLEAASVAGLEFSAASVAAALGSDVETVDERCADLVERGRYLRPAGVAEWPDGTVAARHAFTHGLHQQLWNERIPPARRRRWHLRIGERQEAAYGDRAREVATELALHFEQGGDRVRAVLHLRRAAENALLRSAHAEGLLHLDRALGVVAHLPGTPERDHIELGLHALRGLPLSAVKGLAAPEVEEAYERADEIGHRAGETPEILGLLAGVAAFRFARGEFTECLQICARALGIAERAGTPRELQEARSLFATGALFVGDLLPIVEQAERLTELRAQLADDGGAGPYGTASSLYAFTLGRSAMARWILGQPDQALGDARAAVEAAAASRSSWSHAWSLDYLAHVHLYRHESAALRAVLADLRPLVEREGIVALLPELEAFEGIAVALAGEPAPGIAKTRRAIEGARAAGMGCQSLFRVWLAETEVAAGRTADGLRTVEDAFAELSGRGGHIFDAQFWRLRGELVLAARGSQAWDAEACFHEAIAIARKQGSKSFELRAATSLARLWHSRGRTAEARERLAEIYGWFSEGFGTADLRAARALLEELSGSRRVARRTGRKRSRGAG